ncbi:MAG: hypothetical protein JXQ73_18525 [Phycisphaerae bacterium]|nr:hypothetical protein [Phycisphaerae bacterium]
MNERNKKIVKLSLAGLLLIVSLGFGISRLHYVLATGEEGLSVWFYDQSEQELYPVAKETIPPHEGIGGRADDGVRAVVVVAQADQNDPTKRQIAYLETYTPDLKRLLEDVRAARAAGRPYKGTIPSRESEFFQKNTMVRRAAEADWHESTSEEGLRITTEWRSWPCWAGSRPVVCTP